MVQDFVHQLYVNHLCRSVQVCAVERSAMVQKLLQTE